MTIQYPPLAFDFYQVMHYYGIQDGSGSLYQYTPYYFDIPNTPTDSSTYLSTIIWYDDRTMPTWTQVLTDGYAAYLAWYGSTQATYQDIIDVKNTEDTLISAVPTQVQSDWNSSSGFSKILNKPSLATVATSGSYTDLSSKPSLSTVATTGSYSDLFNKPTLGIAYEGTTQRTNSFPIFKSVSVSSGVAVFQLTSDGTSSGAALFPNGVIVDSVNVSVNDATAAYQMSWVFTNSNKTLTITANKLTTSNILTGILGQTAANSATVKLSVWGY